MELRKTMYIFSRSVTKACFDLSAATSTYIVWHYLYVYKTSANLTTCTLMSAQVYMI